MSLVSRPCQFCVPQSKLEERIFPLFQDRQSIRSIDLIDNKSALGIDVVAHCQVGEIGPYRPSFTEIVDNRFLWIGEKSISLFVITNKSLLFDTIVSIDRLVVGKFPSSFGGDGGNSIDCFRDKIVFGKGAVEGLTRFYN